MQRPSSRGQAIPPGRSEMDAHASLARTMPALSQTTEKLLRAAASLEQADNAGDDAGKAARREFTQIYREWITFERGVTAAPEQQVEQWQMLMHCMVGATTLEEALRLRIRFGRVVWGDDRGLSDLRSDGDHAVLIFAGQFRDGPEGLIGAIWQLSLALREMEFLGGKTFNGVKACVRQADCLPDSVASLLFDRPLSYRAHELALSLPCGHLATEIVMRAADLPEFFRRLLPTTLGSRGSRIEAHSLVGRMIRSDRLRHANRPSDLATIARHLGFSSATLRRRLAAEGWSFRQVKEAALDDVAKLWLADPGMSMDVIAERLGYSDAFAFRRFFHRHNGHSPSTHRRILASA